MRPPPGTCRRHPDGCPHRRPRHLASSSDRRHLRTSALLASATLSTCTTARRCGCTARGGALDAAEMTVEQLLTVEGLGVSLLSGSDLDARPIRWAHPIELLRPSRYLRG